MLFSTTTATTATSLPSTGSNGGMVPPRVSLRQAKEQGIPALLVYYIDDSSDCKRYAATLSSLQVRYGRAIYFIPYSVDSLFARR
jgi:hypothetical protein